MEFISDKELIRNSLKEMAVNEPDFVSTLLTELSELLQHAKKERLAKIIDEDFAEYEAVFRALA
ncbi:MAG: hypothetical protein EOO39_02350 [Cytophagaceae bacterium]|nr:MAG: hypothetical protein EOO39_02350 [Cytophagaceae bacterium]